MLVDARPSRRKLLALLLAAAGTACAQTPANVEAAAQQWRELRRKRGHFDGAAWNDEVDRWQGRKHQAMQLLAQHARASAIAEAELLRLMGPPDARWAAGQATHTDALPRVQWQEDAATPTGATLLMYNWRAERDRLVFALQQGRVIATGWLHDFE